MPSHRSPSPLYAVAHSQEGSAAAAQGGASPCTNEVSAHWRCPAGSLGSPLFRPGLLASADAYWTLSKGEGAPELPQGQAKTSAGVGLHSSCGYPAVIAARVSELRVTPAPAGVPVCVPNSESLQLRSSWGYPNRRSAEIGFRRPTVLGKWGSLQPEWPGRGQLHRGAVRRGKVARTSRGNLVLSGARPDPLPFDERRRGETTCHCAGMRRHQWKQRHRLSTT